MQISNLDTQYRRNVKLGLSTFGHISKCNPWNRKLVGQMLGTYKVVPYSLLSWLITRLNNLDLYGFMVSGTYNNRFSVLFAAQTISFTAEQLLRCLSFQTRDGGLFLINRLVWLHPQCWKQSPFANLTTCARLSCNKPVASHMEDCGSVFFASPSTYLSVSQSTYCIYLSIYPSIHPSIQQTYLPSYLPTYLPCGYLSVYSFVYLSICLSIYLPTIYLSTYLSSYLNIFPLYLHFGCLDPFQMPCQWLPLTTSTAPTAFRGQAAALPQPCQSPRACRGWSPAKAFLDCPLSCWLSTSLKLYKLIRLLLIIMYSIFPHLLGEGC